MKAACLFRLPRRRPEHERWEGPSGLPSPVQSERTDRYAFDVSIGVRERIVQEDRASNEQYTRNARRASERGPPGDRNYATKRRARWFLLG